MSWRSFTFATPPVLAQDSQGPQTAVPPHAKFGGSNGVHKAGVNGNVVLIIGKKQRLTELFRITKLSSVFAMVANEEEALNLLKATPA
jgi:hypothetical protein